MGRNLIYIALLLVLMLASNSSARVWYIKADGTGDAPNIQAGIDSSIAGDTVLVSDGEYGDDQMPHPFDFNGKAIVVKSERGPGNAYIVGDFLLFSFHSGEDSLSVLEGFTFYSGVPAIKCSASSPTIRNNFFSGHAMTYALYLHNSRTIICDNRITCEFGSGIRCVSDSSVIRNNVLEGGDEQILICCTDSHNKIVGNKLATMSNAICCSGGSYEIIGNSVVSGWAPAIECGSANAVIKGNTVTGGAGGIFISGGTYTIEGNTILGCADWPLLDEQGRNAALPTWPVTYGEGAAIQCANVGASTVIKKNLIYDNATLHGGGTMYCDHADPVISENVFVANRGYNETYSAVLFCNSSSPLVINNTIADNVVCGGAIRCINQSSPEIRQNIIVRTMKDPWEGCVASPGICVADTTCHPRITCNDLFNNEGGNYAGIPDQTGMNGNISVDPLFCNAEDENYQLHALSPCLPGNHPDGAECGLIGALGMGCNYVATLLQAYQTEVEASEIIIRWRLSEAGEQMNFLILRAELPGTEFGEIPGASTLRDGLSFEFKDRGCSAGSEYRYRVDVVDEAGRRPLFETDPVSLAPLRFALYQNHPNPFNPSTEIKYYLPGKSQVTLDIYDISGKRISQLVKKEQEKGFYTAAWNGLDIRGTSVSSGVYFYRLTAGKETISKKMVLLR